MKIIGLGITAQVGKDTAAAYLEKKFPGQVKPLAFAYKLKKIALLLNQNRFIAVLKYVTCAFMPMIETHGITREQSFHNCWQRRQ